MSRGRGRGTFRGPAGTHRIAGVDIPADEDIQLNERPPPTPDYPVYEVGRSKEAGSHEKLQVTQYTKFRHRIHGGPMHSLLSQKHRVSKSDWRANTSAAHFNPFEGMETWSQRYAPKKQSMPKLNERPYVFRLFPKELWTTLDPHHSITNGTASSVKTKKLLNFDRGLSDDEDQADPDQDGDAPEEEDVDDDFTDDESQGDYNAEQYFEAGDELDGDDDDGGGGGDYD